MAASGHVDIRLYSQTQGSVLTTYDYSEGEKGTRKWHEALVEHAKKTWESNRKTGTVQSLPYVGVRWQAGQIPPPMWGDDTRHLKTGDIVPHHTKEFKVMVREASGAIRVPPTVGALLNNYFPGGAEKLVVIMFVP